MAEILYNTGDTIVYNYNHQTYPAVKQQIELFPSNQTNPIVEANFIRGTRRLHTWTGITTIDPAINDYKFSDEILTDTGVVVYILSEQEHYKLYDWDGRRIAYGQVDINTGKKSGWRRLSTEIVSGFTSGGTLYLVNNENLTINAGLVGTGESITGATLGSPGKPYELVISTKDSGYTVDLSPLAVDNFISGGTYNKETGVVVFSDTSGNSFSVSGFTSGLTETYYTNASSFNNNTGTLNLVSSTGTRDVTVTGFTKPTLIRETFDENNNYNILTFSDGTSITGSTPFLNFTYSDKYISSGSTTDYLILTGSNKTLKIVSGGITTNSYNGVPNIEINGTSAYRLKNYSIFNKIFYSIKIEVESYDYFIMETLFTGKDIRDIGNVIKTIDTQKNTFNESYTSDGDIKTLYMTGFINPQITNDAFTLVFNISDPFSSNASTRVYRINKIDIIMNNF